MSEVDKEQEKNKKDHIRFNLEMGDNISIREPLRVGRIPIPEEDLEPHFTIYQPEIDKVVEKAYLSLFRIWIKQGKDLIQELKKIEKSE